jgi:hypothetical protein
MLCSFCNWLINIDCRRLKIYRNNMYAAGAGTKIATVFFFVFIMTGGFCNSISSIIATIICTGAGNARQQQQVNTKYEQDCFHVAKITVYEKLFRCNQNYYHNKVAMTIIILPHLFSYTSTPPQPGLTSASSVLLLASHNAGSIIYLQVYMPAWPALRCKNN